MEEKDLREIDVNINDSNNLKEGNDSQSDYSFIEKQIKDLRGPSLLGCIGGFSCLGCISSAVILFLDISAGTFNWGLLISTIVLLILGLAWFLVQSKFEASADLHNRMYREIKKINKELEKKKSS